MEPHSKYLKQKQSLNSRSKSNVPTPQNHILHQINEVANYVLPVRINSAYKRGCEAAVPRRPSNRTFGPSDHLEHRSTPNLGRYEEIIESDMVSPPEVVSERSSRINDASSRIQMKSNNKIILSLSSGSTNPVSR